MTDKVVAILGTLDTKGEEFAFLKQRIETQGVSTLVIDAGILDGDIVIIERANTAQTGDIVVALVDEEEATLKRFRRQDGKIALEAANPAYETRILPADRVRIQGKLAGLVRKY